MSAHVVVPDLAGWRRERMADVPDVAFFDLAPDWVCEVISPSTALHDRHRKRAVYERHRVGWLWFVDPMAKLLEGLKLDGDSYRLHATFGDDEVVRAEPFDAVELELRALWSV